MPQQPLANPRRRVITASVSAFLAGAWTYPARAQSYPVRPIKLVVAFGTGSVNDTIARDLAQQMGETLGQPVVVENRTGAGGAVGTAAVAKAPPDGYTVGLGTSSQLVMNVGLYKSLPFDVDRDLRSVGLVARTPLGLAASTALPPALTDVIALARAKPGQLSYGSGGAGSISHIAAEAFAHAAGVSLLHVPYKGSAAAIADLTGGHVSLAFDSLLSTLPLAGQGRLHLLAVTGRQRSPLAPATPTFAEQGLADYDMYTWNNLFVPSGTPPDVVDRLNAALNKALASSAAKERLARAGSELLGPTTPARADAFARSERARWVPFVRALGIEVN